MSRSEPIIIVHGGAGDIPNVRVPLKISGVKESATIGYDILKNNGSALDAVEAAVRFMENEEAFNAGKVLRQLFEGKIPILNSVINQFTSFFLNINDVLGYGSVLNLDSEVEMDASIMNGSNLQFGAVTVVKNIENPIRLVCRF